MISVQPASAVRPILHGLALLGLTLSARGQEGRAPDGQPGFGDRLELPGLLDLVRASREEERAWLGTLDALGSEVGLLLAAASEEYRSRGYFALLDAGSSADLAALHAAWREASADPAPILRQGGHRSRALAGMLLDPRFRARAQLHEDFELERSEVADGLSVFRGAATSFVTLTLDEARAIARRVDASAARLRAMRSDLMALRSSATIPHSARVSDPAVAELLSAAWAEDPTAHADALAPLLEQAALRAERMRSALFTERLLPALEAHIAWRQRLLAEANARRAEALMYLPGTPESEDAATQVQQLKKHERIRWAGYSARAGLSADPLDATLAFVAARAADYQWGSLESRALYDRFLFLRGIRHYDHRTLKNRKLDEWEAEALDAVQRPMPHERPAEAGSGRGR
jgi:hypothetical protein